jgi:hypothetical protein
MIRNLDSLKIKISIFILLIKFNHYCRLQSRWQKRSQQTFYSPLLRFACNARTIRPHKIKRVAHYCRLHAIGGKSALNKRFIAI